MAYRRRAQHGGFCLMLRHFDYGDAADEPESAVYAYHQTEF